MRELKGGFLTKSCAAFTYCVVAERLAYDLGGVAHVVVEPSLEFSYRLSEATDRKSPYGGNISVSMAGRGVLKNLFLGGALPHPKDIAGAVRKTVELLISNRSILGAPDWIELQELHAKSLRQQLSQKGMIDQEGIDVWAREFQSEIDGYKEKIRELESELATRDESKALSLFSSDGILPPRLVFEIGTELYDGEFSDRVRSIAQHALDNAETYSIDIRERNFLKRLVDVTSFTGRAARLNAELKQAGKAGKKFGAKMREILVRHNYVASEDGPHLKMSPPDDVVGGPVITLAKTSSDGAHGGGNTASDIAKALGLKRLS